MIYEIQLKLTHFFSRETEVLYQKTSQLTSTALDNIQAVWESSEYISNLKYINQLSSDFDETDY